MIKTHPKYSTIKVTFKWRKKEQACTTFRTFLYNSIDPPQKKSKPKKGKEKQDTKRRPMLPQMRQSCSTRVGKRMAYSRPAHLAFPWPVCSWTPPRAPPSGRAFPRTWSSPLSPLCRVAIARVGRWVHASAPLPVAWGVRREDGVSAGQWPWWREQLEKNGGYWRLVFEASFSFFYLSIFSFLCLFSRVKKKKFLVFIFCSCV